MRSTALLACLFVLGAGSIDATAQQATPLLDFTVVVVDDVARAPVADVDVCVGTNVWSSDAQGAIVFTGEETAFGKGRTDAQGRVRFTRVPGRHTIGGREMRFVVIGIAKPNVGIGATWLNERTSYASGQVTTPVDITLVTSNVVGPIPNTCGPDPQVASNAPPAPTNFQATQRSDAWLDMTWDYAAGQAIDGFRIYAPAVRCFSPMFCQTPGVARLQDRTAWVRLTESLPSQSLPPQQRAEPLVANLGDHPASFASEVITLAITAWSQSRGESAPMMITLPQLPDRYGCSGRAQPVRPDGPVSVVIRSVGGNNPVNGRRKLTPFPDDGTGTITFAGRARASFNGNRYPIADHYSFASGEYPQPTALPFRIDATTFSRPGNTHYALQRARGYACVARDQAGNCIASRFANVTIDGRFENPATRQPFYVAAHLFNNLMGQPDFDPSLADNTLFITDLVAGMAAPDQQDAIGMASLRPEVAISAGMLPTTTATGSMPGFVTGAVRGRVFLVMLQDPADLPGSLVDDGSGNPTIGNTSGVIDWFESDVEMSFTNLPLVDDHCF